jgi:hypothetical protein
VSWGQHNNWSPCGPLPPAFPAGPPRYVMPGSHLLDPPYSAWADPWYPFPRPPWPFESGTRRHGTGLIWGPPLCPPGPYLMGRRV